MSSLLTPISSLFYSFLEPSAFERTGESRDDGDVFSRAFKEHNNGQGEKELLQPSKAIPENVETERWKTNLGHGDISKGQFMTPRSEHERGSEQVAFPPLPTCVLERSSENPGSNDLPRADNNESYGFFSNADDSRAHLTTAIVPPNQPGQYPAPNTAKKLAPSRRPGRKRQILTADGKADKHARFLERNRIAAGKCRREKKVRMEALTDRYKMLQERNIALLDMREELRVEVRRLKGLLGMECQTEQDEGKADWVEREVPMTEHDVDEKVSGDYHDNGDTVMSDDIHDGQEAPAEENDVSREPADISKEQRDPPSDKVSDRTRHKQGSNQPAS